MSDKLMTALAHQSTMDRVLEVLPVPTPAPGAQFVFTLPGDRIYRLRGVSALLTTSAAVGNRLPGITLDDQASVVAGAASNAVTAASLAVRYLWNPLGVNSATSAAGGIVTNGLPDIVVPGGYRLRSVCSAFDAADAWSSINVHVETLLFQPMGVHEYRDALELIQRIMTSPYLLEGTA